MPKHDPVPTVHDKEIKELYADFEAIRVMYIDPSLICDEGEWLNAYEIEKEKEAEDPSFFKRIRTSFAKMIGGEG